MILSSLVAGMLALAVSAPGPVVGYGVATLPDQAMSGRLAARFKAHGQPVFLMGEPSMGLQQGDLIKFPDRAVLIDGDVWQTLQSEGALDALRRSQGSVAQLRARAKSDIWDERRRLVNDGRDKKGYALGASLLRSLETAVGKIPDGRLQLSFERGELVILAPRAFLDALRAPPPVDGPAKPDPVHPLFVTTPATRVFAGRPFLWRCWVLDTLGGPSGAIHVELLSKLPDSMSWNPSSHILSGFWNAGIWPLLVVAKGPGGRTDTLRTSIEARANHLPSLGADIPRAWTGESLSVKPFASDSDHPAESLSIRAVRTPPGAVWDEQTSTLRWTPPDSAANRSFHLGFVVTDPLGDSAEFVREILVGHKDQRVSTDGLAIQLPWDTLVVGRTYEWSTAASSESWRVLGAVLDSVRGSRTTDWYGSSLKIAPDALGIHDLKFHFRVGAASVVKDFHFPIRNARPPVWLSRTGSQGVRIGDTISYQPVAISPEGSKVRIVPAGRLPHGVSWDGQSLFVAPSRKGWMVVNLKATDSNGLETGQYVAWKAVPSNRIQWLLRHEQHALAALQEAQLSVNNGRIGLLVTDFERTFLWNDWVEQDWPMFFVGANILGSQRNELWMDIGLVFRQPNSRMFSGGGMGRIEGRFRPATRVPLEIEASMLGWVHQAILSVDTSGLRNTLTLDRKSRTIDPTFKVKWEEAIDQIEADANDEGNIVLLSRLEAWYGLHRLLQVGPLLWREDRLIDANSRQYIGVGVRTQLVAGPVALRPALRTGWGPGAAGWGVWGDIAFGSPKAR